MGSQAIRLHAATHLLGGSDPLRLTEYAILNDNIVGKTMPAGPTAHLFWWDLTPESGTDFTNAPDTFANDSVVIPPGPTNVNDGTFHGLNIKTPGMYLAFKTNQILTLYNDTTLRTIDTYQHQNFPSFPSNMVFGDPNHINQGHGFHMELWSVVEGGAPTGAILLASANGESSAYHCDVSLFVIRIDSVGIAL